MHSPEHFFPSIIDNTSGSAELLLKLQQELLEFLKNDVITPADKGKIYQQLPDYFGHFAIIQNFLMEIQAAVKEAFGNNDLSAIRIFVDKYNSHSEALPSRLAEKLIRQYDLHNKSVLLLSNSSTITGVLKKLFYEGIQFSIFQCESRPVQEGIIQARQLAESGIQVRIIADMAASVVINKVDLLILGADSYNKDWFVNKIGSFPLALLCRQYNKPVYILADSRKQVKGEIILNDKNNRFNSSELFSPEHKNIKVLNYYFEKTPLSLITALITE